MSVLSVVQQSMACLHCITGSRCSSRVHGPGQSALESKADRCLYECKLRRVHARDVVILVSHLHL